MKQVYMDFHVHSNCSPDSNEPLEEHLKIAQERGFSAICVTDHWDLVEEVEGVFPTLSPSLDAWRRIYEAAIAQANTPQVIAYFGVEVGDGYENPQAVTDILSQYPLDFVIGSVHSLYNSGGMGIYEHIRRCNTQELVEQFFEDYFHTLLIQSQQTFFDTMAHLNYPFRYVNKKYNIDFHQYLDKLPPILEQLIQNDRCFEINTARGASASIWKPVLELYRDLGGKHLTLGADAHVAKHLTLGIPEAVALMKELGFDHYVYFEKRQRKEIPIV